MPKGECVPSGPRSSTACLSPGRGTCTTVLDVYIAHYNQPRPQAKNLRQPDHHDGITAPVTDLAASVAGIWARGVALWLSMTGFGPPSAEEIPRP
jgi:hypothetical protein